MDERTLRCTQESCPGRARERSRVRRSASNERAAPRPRMIRGSTFVAAAVSVLALSVSAHGATEALIKGTPRSDELQGTRQDDRMFGSAGDDTIHGLGGYDVLFGGPGDDTLDGDAGKDYLSGALGDDTLSVDYSGGALDDFASCGAGDDTVAVRGVPNSARSRVRQQLEGAPCYCEKISFSVGLG